MADTGSGPLLVMPSPWHARGTTDGTVLLCFGSTTGVCHASHQLSPASPGPRAGGGEGRCRPTCGRGGVPCPNGRLSALPPAVSAHAQHVPAHHRRFALERDTGDAVRAGPPLLLYEQQVPAP